MKSLKYNFAIIPISVARPAYQLLKKQDSSYSQKICAHQDGSIYLHIPKAGGNSVEKSLGLLKTGHRPLKLFQLGLPKDTFDKAFKFTFVRDPWTRLASAYYYLKSEKCSPEDLIWAKNNLSNFGTFESFVKNYVNEQSVYNYIHLIPQIEFLKDWQGKMHVDFIGKLESVEQDFKALCKQLGKEDIELQHKNKTQGAFDYMSEYDDQMIQIVADAYKQDIDALDYAWPEMHKKAS